MSPHRLSGLAAPLRRVLTPRTNTSCQAYSNTLSRALSYSSPSANSDSAGQTTQSQTSGQKREWLVFMPDQPGALERRLSVRAKHFENLKPAVDSGFWLMGGALLETQPADGETPKMRGSVMLALAESEEEVLEQLRRDPYNKGEVWDWSRVEVHAFRSAFRKST